MTLVSRAGSPIDLGHSGAVKSPQRSATDAAPSASKHVEFSSGVKINLASVDWLSRLQPDQHLPQALLTKLHQHLLAGSVLNEAFDHPDSNFAVQLAHLEKDVAKFALILRRDHTDPPMLRYDLAGFAVNKDNNRQQLDQVGVYQNPAINPELSTRERGFSSYHLVDTGHQHPSFYQVRLKPVRLNSDPGGVYGYEPAADSQFKDKKKFLDPGDPVDVARAQKIRKAYHEDIESHRELVAERRAANVPEEEIAKELVPLRNDTRLKYWTPAELDTIHARNLEKYGREEGPTYEQLLSNYPDANEVIEAAFRSNTEMDILTGLCRVKTE